MNAQKYSASAGEGLSASAKYPGPAFWVTESFAYITDSLFLVPNVATNSMPREILFVLVLLGCSNKIP